MKILEYPKPYSWLQWPVTTKSFKPPRPEKLHVTCKFLGETPVDRTAVIARIPLEQYEWFPEEFDWAPTVFVDCHVLELTRFPRSLKDFHSRFDGFGDRFKLWRPHITVPFEYWERISLRQLTPTSEQLKFGELELCIGTLNQPGKKPKGADRAIYN